MLTREGCQAQANAIGPATATLVQELLDHRPVDRLRVAGRLLAYAGDAEPTPELDELVQQADVAIIEATAPGEVPSHTSWEQAQQLMARHPRTRFFLNHVFSGELDGAVRDLQQIDV
jgi:ribonuclease BN (tRNA processing enzyme)